MNHYVADTHALFWYLTNSPQLGAQACAAFDEADNDQAIIYLPSIVAAELNFFNKEMTALFQAGQFVFVPSTARDAIDFDADTGVGEMHDRIIAGVARRINA